MVRYSGAVQSSDQALTGDSQTIWVSLYLGKETVHPSAGVTAVSPASRFVQVALDVPYCGWVCSIRPWPFVRRPVPQFKKDLISLMMSGGQ